MKIGIALALYQANINYLTKQLASLQSQSYENWICCIQIDSDQGETAKEELINKPELAAFKADSRFIWRANTKRLGHKKNFSNAANFLVTESVNAIAFCDQDDVWDPNKLAESQKLLKNLPNYSLVHHDMRLIDAQDNVIHPSLWQREARNTNHCSTSDLLVRNNVTGCTVLLDAKLIQENPEIPDELDFHDRWYSLLASQKGEIFALSHPLASYRQHDQNLVGSQTQSKEKLSLTNKLKKNLNNSQEFAQALPNFENNIFTKRDFGIGLLARAFFYILSDPPLSRAYFARAITKAFLY